MILSAVAQATALSRRGKLRTGGLPMRCLSVLLAVVLSACSQTPEPPPIEVLALEESLRLEDGAEAPRGKVFATLHIRHQAASEKSCELDERGITIVDARNRRYTPVRTWESRGKSEDKITPHEMRVIYEIPVNTRVEKIAISQWFPLPPRRSSVSRS